MTVNDNLHHNGTIRADWWNYYEGIYFITITVKNRINAFGEIHRDSQTGQNNMNFSQLGRFVNDEIPKIMAHYPYVFVPSWVVMPNHVHFIIMIDVRGKTWNDSISNDGVSNQCRRVSRHAPTTSQHAPTTSQHAPTVSYRVSNDSLSNDAISNDAISNDSISNDSISNDGASNYAISNDGVSNQCRRVSRHAPTISRHAPTTSQHAEYMASIAPKRGSLGLIIGRFKGAITKYANDNHIPFQWQSRFYDSIIFDQNGFERVRHYINNNVANWK